ncbi:MAG: VWA domain-containing protein [Paucibacter sp.]|nr:VWA domain-containing protein [Roseateles sp.]
MLIQFFQTLRAAKLPVSVREFLTLLEGLEAGVIGGREGEPPPRIDDFYHLARATLVKDEAHYDKFDRAFAAYFKGVELLTDFAKELPEDWLKKHLNLELTPEQKAAIEAMGWDELMKTLKERLEEQHERHEGGSRWIGTGGTSPFGNGGYNPAGVRIGGKGGNRSALKVWEQRAYRDYDDQLELGTRNIKVALRRLRRFAREGSELELDLDDTIHKTAANAGMLDIRMHPERHNKVKVLLLMDVGGTMDEHIHRVEELFSAAKSEFKHLEFYYFHNCVYDFVWKNNRRRFAEKFPTWDIIRKYNRDYKLIFVGDATMSPYEILQPGGSVEYVNEEPGAEWLARLTNAFPRYAWINPEPAGVWQYRQSIAIVQQLMHQRMFPLSLSGLEGAMRLLSK